MSNRKDRHLAGGPCQAVDLGETIKTLVHLAREQGHVTYDDVNDILPAVVPPDELDELYRKLRDQNIKVVDFADEHTKPPDAEEDRDHRLDALDDPVGIYMNQMGKVPLLTREQEVEVCQRIEQAEFEVKRLVYCLGFAGKEHSAIAERLLSDPPKERFDRVVVDKKIITREGHLKDLRSLVNKTRVLDTQADENFAAQREVLTPGCRQELAVKFRKLDQKLRDTFPKFFYNQRILDDLVVVAGNVHREFKAGVECIQELKSQPKSSGQQVAIQAQRAKMRGLEQLVRMPQAE